MKPQTWLASPMRWIGGRKAGVDVLVLSALTIIAYLFCAENDYLRERRISGYEALLRWQHPQRGNIPSPLTSG